MTAHTIADVFRKATIPETKLPLHHRRVINDILRCRTSAMGGIVQKCDTCDSVTHVYHSCRNRHCPQCQTGARLAWVNDRLNEMLPVEYFHVVFTMPAQLNPFALRNKKVFYNLMFRAVKETLMELSQDPKRLGADIGFITVLHTWGQNLLDHPHIHCIVPGGGYNPEKKQWKCLNGKFLLPVPVLRKLYRGKLMDFFIQAVKNQTIKLCGNLESYTSQGAVSKLVDDLYRKDWVVYVKEPFASPEALVGYLGAYTHRVALSDKRIQSVEENMVSFAYKDYADDSKQKTMKISADEFLRRFLLHVLPRGFRRIRYYGFLAPKAKPVRFKRCREAFNLRYTPKTKKEQSRSCIEIFKELLGIDLLRCPTCGKGNLITVGLIPKTSRLQMSQ